VDDIVYRPRYSRQVTYQTKRKPRRNKRDRGSFVQKFAVRTVLQTLICLVIFLVVVLVVKIRTPQTAFLQNKLKGAMSYNIDLKKTFGDIQYLLNSLPADKRENESTDSSLYESEDSEKRVLNATTSTESENQQVSDEELEPVSAVYTEEGSLVESAEYIKDELEMAEDRNNVELNANEKIFGTAGYSFIIPVGGIIGSFFGERVHPIKKTIIFHKGIDIEALSGTPIKAAYDGEVVEAGSEATYGNYIKIKHIDGLSTLYAHCSKLLVNKGQKVKKGDIIAEVGATGAADGPHLHFEVRKDNEVVNPLDYIELSDSN